MLQLVGKKKTKKNTLPIYSEYCLENTSSKDVEDHEYPPQVLNTELLK